MKIAFVISSLGSGGAEKILVSLANELSKNNEIHILTFSQEDSFYSLSQKVNHEKLDLLSTSNSFWEKIKNNGRRIYFLTKKMKKIDPDIIISFSTQINIVALIANFYLKKPIIIKECSIFRAENNNTMWKILRRITYPHADYLITLTKEDAKNYSFVKNKIVIPNFIEMNPSNEDTQKEDIILAVGRLHPVKRFDLLIRLYAKLQTNYKLIIVGEGKERSKLEKLIGDLQLEEKVILAGRQKNVEKYYKKAKIFVLTSKYESFSNVIIEAMHFGCVVVSFDCDYGPRSIIHDGYNGFLVSNEKEFIEKLKKVIDNDKLQKTISQNAKERTKDFEKRKIIEKWKELLENVTDKTKIYN